MKKNKVKIILGSSILALLLSVGTFIFVFNVIRNKNEHTSVVLANLENKILEKENKDMLIRKLSQVEDTHKVIDSYLVDKAKADSFVDYIENLRLKTKTDITVKSVDVPADKPHIINMNISIKGKFTSVMQTIDILENIPYKIHIAHIYMNKDLSTKQDLQKTKVVEIPTWQADVSFSVVSS